MNLFPVEYLQAVIYYERLQPTRSLQMLYSLLKTIESHQQQEMPLLSTKEIKKELLSLFCIFPVDPQAKHTMVLCELMRIHSTQKDYRNTHKICQKLAATNPQNLFVLSKCGIQQLEMGREELARQYFVAA